jgi:dienelactone hydrolase
MTLLEARRNHRTKLVRRRPSPQPHAPLGARLPHARRVDYESDGRSLAALWVAPSTARAPALLYLHGGWALDDSHVRACDPFVDAGFAVLAPSYRGENGNPGDQEMLWGELDDAHAALAWLRAQPRVDAERVFVLGHSAGGMLAALMAFEPELPAHLTGSVDGIYAADVFDVQPIPFEDTPRERELRLALPFIEELEQPHIACVGGRDPALVHTRDAARRAKLAGAPLEAVIVPGDHEQSVAPGVAAFLACANQVLA